jgi:hypothetical protein
MSMTRGELCLSDLALDRLLAGELALGERAAADRHLGGCATCASRRVELVAFDAEAEPLLRREAAEAWKSVRPRPRLRRVAAGSAAVVVAAIAVVVLRIDSGRGNGAGSNRTGDRTDVVRPKNGTAIDLVVRHPDGRQAIVMPGETLDAGDTIRFRLASDGGLAAIVAVDESGAISTYRELAPIAAGRDVVVDGAIELDHAHGVERVVAVVCDAAPATALTDVARRALETAGGDPRAIDRLDLPCRQASTWFVQR